MSKSNIIFNKYKNEVEKILATENYTEYSFRFAFEELLTSLYPNLRLIHEPKREKGLGAPDYTAFIGGKKIGYIETKEINDNIDEIIDSEQIQRYIESIDNLILSNYKRIILIKNHNIVEDFLILKEDLIKKTITLVNDSIEKFERTINIFCSYEKPTIKNSMQLANELSKRAKLLKYYAKEQLEEDVINISTHKEISKIYDFYQGMKMLIQDLNINDCADAYAQTITYGFFLAKMNSNNQEITRNTAVSYIPDSISIIKTMFMNISGHSLPRHLTWIPDEIVDVLNVTDMDFILDEFSKYDTKSVRDPFSFFYENFIEIFDPSKRKQLGVYYTPRPVVNFIVNCVHNVLKEWFNKESGLAEDNVTVLDFATGTGTFLWMTYLVTLVELVNSKKRGLIDGKIQDHILKDFYGFEVMVTPYIIAHLKLTSVLREWRYKLKNGERIPVYLTNTLEPTNVSGLYYFLRDLAEESRIANVVKGPDKKIFVILGNPPYARISVNTGKWINKLLKNGYVSSDGKTDYGYYKLDGKPLNERNSRWLQDDYVKFIRYAQWKIDKNGEGVIGIITNHSYLDNLTFRGMRQSLLNSFDRIYIINLHGHTRKEIIGLLGGDENVFDIMQGVAITIFIKNSDFKNKMVLYKDIYGSRASKFEWLDSKKSVLNVDWEVLEPTSPNYYLIPVDYNLKEKYDDSWKITDIFPEHNVGIATTRDDFVLSFKRNDLEERMNDFKSDKHDLDYWKEEYNLKNKIDWNLIEVKNEISKYDNLSNYIKLILYRPFDLRWIFYDKKLVERPRIEIMKNMISPKISELNILGKNGKNIGLILSRSSAKSSFSNVIITEELSEIKCGESTRGSYLLPLYILKKINGEEKWEENISNDFMKYLHSKYSNKVISIEDILGYVYGILHSKRYRIKYREFLKKDFPNIPFPDDYEDFLQISVLGKKLANLHLFRESPHSTTPFDVEGEGIVINPKYNDKKLYINNLQFFGDISEEVWDFDIGGHKVIQKWLKNRNKIKLDSEDIQHLIKTINIIKDTLLHVEEIEKNNYIKKL